MVPAVVVLHCGVPVTLPFEYTANTLPGSDTCAPYTQINRPSSLDDTALVKAPPTAFCNNNKQNDDKTTAYVNEFAVEQVEDADLVQRVECRTQNNDLSV